MVAVRYISLLLITSLVALFSSRDGAGLSASEPNKSEASLYAQSTAQALARDFPSSDISFLLLDARTGSVLAARWDDPDTPIPMGSLMKPFTALAYGEQHDFRYPRHTCRGTATGCWLPRGHGDEDLTSAIAHSCNSYFRMLTANLTAADVSLTAERLGLDRPDNDASGAELAGLGVRWRTSPLRVARAYLELIRRRQQPGVNLMLTGMGESAREGTGAEVHRVVPFPDVLVKTGTAVCTHNPHAPGDGFVVAITPADHPQTLLLVRVHGVPGAQAARTAGLMLRRMQN